MNQRYGTYSVNQIAQALNLSRSTVSKVLNGRPGVSEKTYNLIMNYIHAADKQPDNPSAGNASGQMPTIMFSYCLENIEYINGLLAGIEEALKNNGYLLAVNIVTRNSGEGNYLPPSVYSGSVKGIISFNIYDLAYWEEVCALPVPSVFLDTIYDKHRFSGKTDIILPENEAPLMEAITALAREGRRNFGFLGYPYFCYSLYQRWETYRNTLKNLGLPLNEENCILDDFDQMPDIDMAQALKNRLIQMKNLPDAYICTSDKQAIQLLRALKELSVCVPQDVAVIGFDNLPESLRQDPPLSTVDAYSSVQGSLAVTALLDRIAHPDRPHITIQCQTKLLLRESSGHSTRIGGE
ncbi:LacI family DNA-binding transcriptional regulator [Diplocloster agilis]|uniref:LacI family DNA-binding transcriptional regulator n=1 Tax=Diplocloster agilis TaxID=2850323 RepID=A0A949K3E8_9FIRM|nr:LacI family DNA-binding transcriptional regulator [Diplocloster agilis]MBU9739544.1 LacI family DNA-binding transcriptional regulator [Diplocloster agilis]MBU9745228.1 LacI family DNA-binding transcriptional regulator [Diplocloster agilis]